MIIKSVFRRYERWNPVHPTSGAFWGVGLGIGCGVGWGPGFGPEVIGYVGAGCGVGFSVGFTLLGVGIGLPTNYIFTVPHNVFMATRQHAMDVAQARGLLGNSGRAGDGWGDISSLICHLQQNRHVSFPRFKIDNLTEGMIDLNDVKSELGFRAKYITDSLRRATGRFFPWERDRETQYAAHCLVGGSKS